MLSSTSDKCGGCARTRGSARPCGGCRCSRMAGDHLAFFEEHDFGRAAAHLQNHRVRACKKRAFILKRFLYREIHEVGFFDVLDDADVKTGLKIDAVDERVSVGRFPERTRADHLNVRRLQTISLQELAEGAQDGNSLAQAVREMLPMVNTSRPRRDCLEALSRIFSLPWNRFQRQ